MMRPFVRRSRADQRGLTILELTIGISLMLLLSATALSMLQTTQDRVRFTSKETESLDAARTTIARISREVRDAAKIYDDADCPVATCLTVAVQPPGGGPVVDIRYRHDAAVTTLFRSIGARNPLTGEYLMSGTEGPVVTNVTNPAGTAVFCRKVVPCTVPSEKAVKVVLIVNVEPSRPSQAVTLEAYVTPRNQT